MPTAIAKNIDITLYDTQNLNTFSKHLLANKQDALVVGHSYSTGVLAGLLTNETIGDIDLDIYNRIYQDLIDLQVDSNEFLLLCKSSWGLEVVL